jgi:hypothetical protein
MSEPVAPYRPHRLKRRDLAVPITGDMKRLATDDVLRLHDERLRLHERFAPFGPRTRRRLVRYAIAGAVGFPLLNLLFLPAGTSMLWLQVLLGAAYGGFVAVLRPTGMVAGFAFMALALAAQAIVGKGSLLSIGMVIVCLVYFCFGLALGIDEENRIADGA